MALEIFDFGDMPVPLILAIVLATAIIAYVVFYLTWCFINMRFERHLREPPEGWKDYLEKASDLGAHLPSFGEKTHAVRRQLILATDDASRYSTNRVLTIPKGLPKSAFSPKYDDQGTQIGRKVIFGYFHPFADAGGGGERVLWSCVRETLKASNDYVCAIYIAKHDEIPDDGNLILERVEARFGIELDSTRIVFVFMNYGSLVKAATWKRFTLIGQAIGSVVLAYQAIATLVPDVFIDTAGHPFSYPIVEWLLQIPVGAYVHYPVVQRDMLNKVSTFSFKALYWRLFMFSYSYMARYCTLPVTNSTWTLNHLKEIWKTFAARPDLITTVYPPVATQDFEPPSEDTQRKPNVVYLAQFRPEKRHDLVLREFASFLAQYREAHPDAAEKPHLVFIGSIRGDEDSQSVYSLRLLARELELGDDYVTFLLDAPWTTVQKIMKHATVGVNAMWNEHFGMVVVEYMAAGLIPVCHDSAGPKMDIIVEDETGKKPGLLFTSEEDPDYVKNDKEITLSQALGAVFEMSEDQKQEMRERAFKSAQRFSDAEFDHAWGIRVRTLAKIENLKRKRRLLDNWFD